jgi:hypothetical protein
MQVIRHGTKWSDEFPKRKMCNKCKCVFLYDRKDMETTYIETTFDKNLHSPPIAQNYLYCPECDKKIILYKEEK